MDTADTQVIRDILDIQHIPAQVDIPDMVHRDFLHIAVIPAFLENQDIQVIADSLHIVVIADRVNQAIAAFQHPVIRVHRDIVGIRQAVAIPAIAHTPDIVEAEHQEGVDTLVIVALQAILGPQDIADTLGIVVMMEQAERVAIAVIQVVLASQVGLVRLDIPVNLGIQVKMGYPDTAAIVDILVIVASADIQGIAVVPEVLASHHLADTPVFQVIADSLDTLVIAVFLDLAHIPANPVILDIPVGKEHQDFQAI